MYTPDGEQVPPIRKIEDWGKGMRLIKLLLPFTAVAIWVIGPALPALGARGVTSPSTPVNHNVGPAPTYYSFYSQDYGDPRCPSNVDESKNKCITQEFAIGQFDGGIWHAINPQSGCGVQDHCTYGTDLPCPPAEGQAPGQYQARFIQHVIPNDPSQSYWMDTRFSGTVTLNPCSYHVITPGRVA
jgi:hypothetical protein